jgi:hypothetical protein
MSHIKAKPILIFIILWLHVSILDLFFVTQSSIVFLWQENARIETLVVHFLIALTAAAFYWLVSYIRQTSIISTITNNNKLWVISSAFLLALIVYLMV